MMHRPFAAVALLVLGGGGIADAADIYGAPASVYGAPLSVYVAPGGTYIQSDRVYVTPAPPPAVLPHYGPPRRAYEPPVVYRSPRHVYAPAPVYMEREPAYVADDPAYIGPMPYEAEFAPRPPAAVPYGRRAPCMVDRGYGRRDYCD